MASLTRWSDRIAPRWLGNDRDPHPFSLQYRRLSRGEGQAFDQQLRELQEAGAYTVDGLHALLAPAVRGPLRAPDAPEGAPALSVDGEPIQERDLLGLLRLGMEEGARLKDTLVAEIVATLLRVNGVSEVEKGES